MSVALGGDTPLDGSLSDSEAGSKRKGSPLTKGAPLKKQISSEDLTSLSKTADRKATKAARTKSTGVAFSDMIKLSFNDQTFRDSITPVLADMVSPLIEQTVHAATAGMKTIVEDMIKSNKALQGTMEKLNSIIKDQKSIITKQQNIIDEQKIMLDSNSSSIEDLQCMVHSLSSEIDQLRLSHNDLEQYGRRNSLRINNLKFDRPMGPSLDEEQLTIAVLHFLNTEVLKDARKLDVHDIERCHYVGRPKQSGSKQILVKFSRYHDKRRVFLLKKVLKNHPNKTFMTEDLTAMNHEVIKTLLPLKKGGNIDSFWTRDGRIIVKKGKEDDPKCILPSDNIHLALGLVKENEEVMELGATGFSLD